MEKKPSEIRFSQKTIWHRFRRNSGHTHLMIGQTLDMIMNGECSIKTIPVINVKHDEEKNEWITADNRRLWIFQQLERLGRCNFIRLEKTFYIDSMKMSSENGGVSVDIKYGDSPGGEWYKVSDATYMNPLELHFTKQVIDGELQQSDDFANSSVQNLTERLKIGSAESTDVPSIMVLRTSAEKKVVDGNKRLWAFKEANKHRHLKLQIRCIIFEEMDQLPSTLRCKLLSDGTRKLDETYENCHLEEDDQFNEQLESLTI